MNYKTYYVALRMAGENPQSTAKWMVRVRTYIKLWPSALVRTGTDITLWPIGLERSYKV